MQHEILSPWAEHTFDIGKATLQRQIRQKILEGGNAYDTVGISSAGTNGVSFAKMPPVR